MSKKVNGNEEMNQEEMNNIPETPETEKEAPKKEKIINMEALKSSKGVRFVKKALPVAAGIGIGIVIGTVGLLGGDKKAEELSDSLSGLLPDGEKKDDNQIDSF